MSLFTGSVLFGNSLLIHSKALLAQLLIQQAWEDIQSGEVNGEGNGQGKAIKPWPWADTWPVARLYAPRQEQDLYILDGANGSSFAFGPGRYRGVESTIIAGHRDTHFRFLKDIRPGDRLIMENPRGEQSVYEVSATRVADRFRESLRPAFGVDSLTLITCYPFDAIKPGGPLRYVVTALPVEARLPLRNANPSRPKQQAKSQHLAKLNAH